ncbi:hypothetical protein JTB14_033592 [Gonioctena quinquepunctata]|nr:hypothetical protein JTB14_033592 [Gonioctena quinquepunctata]
MPIRKNNSWRIQRQNRGANLPSWRRATRSFIDVTLASQKIAKSITNWRVLDDETLTEHKFIEYNIGGKSANKNKYPSTIDWEACTTLINWFTDEKIPPNLKEYNEAIRKIHQGCLIENDTKTSNVYWWNADIANKRKDCTRHRREITRKRRNRNTNARDIEEAEDLYKTAKKELRNLINESKKKCWQELLKDLENDVWGEGFKIVMKQHRSYVPYSLTRQSKAKAVIELFPCGTNINVRREEETALRPFTIEEVKTCLETLKNRKAPGTDGIPVEI